MNEPTDFVAEQSPTATKESIEAAAAAYAALERISNLSFSGRHPELGRMINCQICSMRHRENERKCEQKFAKTEDGVVYGELVPPEGLTHLTARQILGSQYFAKRRINPHGNRWAKARANKAAAKLKRKKNNEDEHTALPSSETALG